MARSTRKSTFDVNMYNPSLALSQIRAKAKCNISPAPTRPTIDLLCEKPSL
ncbi:hypothetical protein Rhal01_01704 [Rubritalea halochordaticola]|uniref:Uncharacterized protein n=1 Tax=Rubritalea halochordaticola TaxID=714537 RepID=A0ABP9V2L5_9BACT